MEGGLSFPSLMAAMQAQHQSLQAECMALLAENTRLRSQLAAERCVWSLRRQQDIFPQVMDFSKQACVDDIVEPIKQVCSKMSNASAWDLAGLPNLASGWMQKKPAAVESKLAASPSLPWMDELPRHIVPKTCKACVQIAQRVAARGLDESRAHHGFTIIIGNPKALESCGRSGFNPFQGHDEFVLNSDGSLNSATFDILRRNAFHADGAIVVDGATGRVVASGWFVGNISKGGDSGGARTRAARAVAQQAGGCFVIKCSEDSKGELCLHFNGAAVELPTGGQIDQETRCDVACHGAKEDRSHVAARACPAAAVTRSSWLRCMLQCPSRRRWRAAVVASARCVEEARGVEEP